LFTLELVTPHPRNSHPRTHSDLPPKRTTTSAMNTSKAHHDWANQCQAMVRLYYRSWLKGRFELDLLATRCTHNLFAINSLQVNMLILKDLNCKPLRECLRDVTKKQHVVAKQAKMMRKYYKKGMEADRLYWEARYVITALERLIANII
jgi:hypothetical protein